MKTRKRRHRATHRKSMKTLLSFTKSYRDIINTYPSKPKYLIHSTEYPENLERILTEGIRPSANTGVGRFEYHMVKIKTVPENKSQSNTIMFNQVFTELLYDENAKFNVGHPLPEYIIILDMKLIDNLCKDKGCHLGLQWVGGKKIKNNYIEYNTNKSVSSNLKSWTKYIKSYAPNALVQNELVFGQAIDPKYIKAVLLLPPVYKNYYIDNNDKIKWIPPGKLRAKDITDEYLTYVYNTKIFKKLFPHIKFASTWEDLEEMLKE